MSRQTHADTKRLVRKELRFGGRTGTYFEMGSPSDQVMLLLPGWMMTGNIMYANLAKAFVEKGYRVVIPVQPGHGGTSNLAPNQLTPSALAVRNLEFLDNLPGVRQPVSVFGNSAMGLPSLFMHGYDPRLIRNVILLNSFGGTNWKDGVTMNERSEASYGLAFWRESVQRRGPEITWRFWREAGPNAVLNFQGMYQWSKMGRAEDARSVTALLSGVPTSIQAFQGTRDRVVSAASAEELGEILGIDVIRVPNASHATPVVEPTLWINQISGAESWRGLSLVG